MIGLGGETAERLQCSRAGCTAVATQAITWRNPKIHRDERHKTWLACDEHLQVLHDFLAARDFPIDIIPVGALDD